MGGKDAARSSLATPVFTLVVQLLFSHEDSSFQMFSSEAYGQKNLLFKDSTLELVPIATQNYEAWLGREYLRAMKGLLCDPNRESSCGRPRQRHPRLDGTRRGSLPGSPGQGTSPGSLACALWPLESLSLCCLAVWRGLYSNPIARPMEPCESLQGLGLGSWEPV